MGPKIAVALCVLLMAPLLDPEMPGAAQLEARAVQFGHVRMCLTLDRDADKAQTALDAILNACPEFFTSRELPRLCADAFKPPEQKPEAARARLTALGKSVLLTNAAFGSAVRYYVTDAKLLERGEAFQDRASPVLAKLRERENAALCWQSASCLSVAVSSLATSTGLPPAGPLAPDLLARAPMSACERPVCAATGKPTFTWDGQRVVCTRHGATAPVDKLATEEQLRKAATKNPMLWAVDHLRRTLAAEAAVRRLPPPGSPR